MAAKINGLLQDPEAMKQIQALAGMFGAGQSAEAEASAPPPPEPKNDAPSAVSPEMMQMAMKLLPLLSGFNKETENTRFLHALRPLLSDKRQKKLDDAAKMMQLMQMLPLLKKSGIL